MIFNDSGLKIKLKGTEYPSYNGSEGGISYKTKCSNCCCLFGDHYGEEATCPSECSGELRFCSGVHEIEHVFFNYRKDEVKEKHEELCA